MLIDGRSVADAAAATRAQLAGWQLTTQDDALAQALIATGATLTRHAFIMSSDLIATTDQGSSLESFVLLPMPVSADIESWAHALDSWRAAFPPGHPDYIDMSNDGDAVQFFTRLVDGSEMGPLHRSSCLLANPQGRALAGIIVNLRSGEPPRGGPWISDIWRDPALRGSGVGPALIERSKRQLADDGYTALTLAVTASNDAHRSYERAGFTMVMNSRYLNIPA
jgi:GNAT superfamily N-acetyltransferase